MHLIITRIFKHMPDRGNSMFTISFGKTQVNSSQLPCTDFEM